MLPANIKIDILRLFSTDLTTLDSYLKDLSCVQLIEVRQLVEDVILDKFSESESLHSTLGELQKEWTPVAKYFDANNCRETVDACVDDSCHTRNAVCFSGKLRGQIGAELDFYFRKVVELK